MSNKYSSYNQFLEENTTKNSNISDRDNFVFPDSKARRKTNGLVGYAPSLPLTFSKEGPFDLHADLSGVVKQNFKNLILTEPGERVMDINFGVGLKKYLFENKTVALREEIMQNIQKQVSTYMSYLNIDNIRFEDEQTEPNSLYISIYYSIPSLSIEDALSVAIGE